MNTQGIVGILNVWVFVFFVEIVVLPVHSQLGVRDTFVHHQISSNSQLCSVRHMKGHTTNLPQGPQAPHCFNPCVW